MRVKTSRVDDYARGIVPNFAAFYQLSSGARIETLRLLVDGMQVKFPDVRRADLLACLMRVLRQSRRGR